MEQIVQQAQEYHVILVPEIDVPGHDRALVAGIPELHGKLNISSNATLEILQGLFDEVMGMIPGPYWHLGADEYPNQHSAAYVGFINTMNTYVRSRNRTMLVWEGFYSVNGSNASAPQVDRSVLVMPFDSFHADKKPVSYYDAGYTIVNAAWAPNYFCGAAYPYELAFWDPSMFGCPSDHTTPPLTHGATSRDPHTNWQRLPQDIWNPSSNLWPNTTKFPYPFVPKPQPARIAGGALCSWAQDEATEVIGWFGVNCTATGLEAPRAAIFAEKMWRGAASVHDDLLKRVGCPITPPTSIVREMVSSMV